MSYIFFGTPRFAAIILEKLIAAGLPPALVIANPDRPAGRKKELRAPETKLIAAKYGLHAHQPEKPEVKSLKFEVDKLGDIDFAVVAAYGNIIKKDVLDLPRLGTIGVHPSLLPLYRGATPIQSAILGGETTTGTTLFLLDEGVDSGPILAQEKIAIGINDDYLALETKLADLSADLLIKTIPDFLANRIKPMPQDHTRATMTKKFKTEDGLVDLSKDAPETIYRKIKALNPEPGVYTFIEKGDKKIRVKLLDANLLSDKLQLKLIQLEGGKPIPAQNQLPAFLK